MKISIMIVKSLCLIFSVFVVFFFYNFMNEIVLKLEKERKYFINKLFKFLWL